MNFHTPRMDNDRGVVRGVIISWPVSFAPAVHTVTATNGGLIIVDGMSTVEAMKVMKSSAYFILAMA